MGQCYGKTIPTTENDLAAASTTVAVSGHRNQVLAPASTPRNGVKNTPARSGYPSPWPSPYPHGVAPTPARMPPSPARGGTTPGRRFLRHLIPPSPARPITALKRLGGGQSAKKQPKESPIPEHGGGSVEPEHSLDKNFGYGKNFGAKYELGEEVGKGHFGHTCKARGKKGELKDQEVAVKIISKAKNVVKLILEFALSHSVPLGSSIFNLQSSIPCEDDNSNFN